MRHNMINTTHYSIHIIQSSKKIPKSLKSKDNVALLAKPEITYSCFKTKA